MCTDAAGDKTSKQELILHQRPRLGASFRTALRLFTSPSSEEKKFVLFFFLVFNM